MTVALRVLVGLPVGELYLGIGHSVYLFDIMLSSPETASGQINVFRDVAGQSVML